MAVALHQSLRLAIGYRQQTDLVTPLAAGSMWSLSNTSREVPNPNFINQNDKDDLGKGIYPTQQYPSHIDTAFPISGRMTSEWGAELAAFGLGKATKTAAGAGFKYTCTEYNPDTDGLDMPATTIVAKIPSGGGVVTDKKFTGMCCEEWGVSLKSGPGRDNAQFSSQWVGTGSFTTPSGIVLPAKYAEHGMNAGNISTLTLLGVNFITNKRFVSLDFRWKNNMRLDAGHYPGSGQQSGYQVRGRMRRGVPEITCQVVVEADTAATEEASLTAQTTGTMVLLMEGAVIGAGPDKHTFKITIQKASFRTLVLGENDGITTYQIELDPLQHATNGVITVEAICEQDNILAA